MSGTTSGLTAEEKAAVLQAARSGLLDLVAEHPELSRLDTEIVTRLYLAGVRAGVLIAAGLPASLAEAFDRVLTIGLRDRDGES